ncbi:anhydro-N-acetylmuramic acid kinase (plasmid) [Pseudoalteromonas espejiana]
MFSAAVIANALNECARKVLKSVLCTYGGGIHNLLLMAQLNTLCPSIKAFKNTDDLGINPDAKEAVLFAIFSQRVPIGEQQHLNNTAQGGCWS